MLKSDHYIYLANGLLTENPESCFLNIDSIGWKKVIKIICSGITL